MVFKSVLLFNDGFRVERYVSKAGKVSGPSNTLKGDWWVGKKTYETPSRHGTKIIDVGATLLQNTLSLIEPPVSIALSGQVLIIKTSKEILGCVLPSPTGHE